MAPEAAVRQLCSAGLVTPSVSILEYAYINALQALRPSAKQAQGWRMPRGQLQHCVAHWHLGCPLNCASFSGPSESPFDLCSCSSAFVYSSCSDVNTCRFSRHRSQKCSASLVRMMRARSLLVLMCSLSTSVAASSLGCVRLLARLISFRCASSSKMPLMLASQCRPSRPPLAASCKQPKHVRACLRMGGRQRCAAASSRMQRGVHDDAAFTYQPLHIKMHAGGENVDGGELPMQCRFVSRLCDKRVFSLQGFQSSCVKQLIGALDVLTRSL